MTIKQLIDNWFIGNKRENIPPFAVLQLNNVAHIKLRRVQGQGNQSFEKWGV